MVQILSALVLALLFSRWGEGSASGWGDLIGVIVGIVVGAGGGVGIVLVLAARQQQRTWRHQATVMALATPSAIAAIAVAGVVRVDFWVALVAYLVISMVVVWSYAGRSTV